MSMLECNQFTKSFFILKLEECEELQLYSALQLVVSCQFPSSVDQNFWPSITVSSLIGESGRPIDH